MIYRYYLFVGVDTRYKGCNMQMASEKFEKIYYLNIYQYYYEIYCLKKYILL